MEVFHKEKQGFIEVWLTNEEQKTCDRKELTALLLSDIPPKKRKKCKVVFFLSGKEELYPNVERLIVMNAGCV